MTLHIEQLSDEALARLAVDVKAELLRRKTLCPDCGGQMRLWHMHICGDNGGTNVPLDSPIAKALVR